MSEDPGFKSAIPQSKGLDLEIAKATPQLSLVLEYLASGRGLSVLIAHTVLGVTSLTTRIAELRKHGIPISGKWLKTHGGKRYMVYHYDPQGGGRDE